MALYYELQVFKDVYTLVQKVLLYTPEFLPEYKYKPGQVYPKVSIEIMDMTFDQEKEYIKNQLAELKLKKHGRQ